MSVEEIIPSFKNLTKPSYGKPEKEQRAALQELTKPHIESFNFLLKEGVARVVQSLIPVEFALPNGDRVYLDIQSAQIYSPRVADGNTRVSTQQVYPAECRERGTSYSGKLKVELLWKINGTVGGIVEKDIGRFPIMVKSESCNLHGLKPAELVAKCEEAEEMGGYFIINGLEKVMRMLIMPRRNFPLCMTRNSWKTRGNQYTEYGVSIRCVGKDEFGVTNILHYLSNGSATLSFAYNKQMYFVPVIFILKALVQTTDKCIYDELIKGKEDDAFYKGNMVFMLRQALTEDLTNQQKVLKYIGERFRVRFNLPEWYTDAEAAKFMLKHCVCVHLDSDKDKFSLLVYMIRKLYSYTRGECASESQDNTMFQEVLLSGHLLTAFLKEKLEKWLLNIRLSIEKIAKSKAKDGLTYELDSGKMSFAVKHAGLLTKSFEYLLATGNLDSSSGLGMMQMSGLSVHADKLNYMRYLSHFRAVHRGAFFTTMRTTAVRKMLSESWGFLCPVHTPDGTPCGLLNHMTAFCKVVNVNYNTTNLIKVLYSMGVTPLDVDTVGDVKDNYSVLLDGRFIGYVSDQYVQQVSDKLRVMKVKNMNKVPTTMEICLVAKTEFASQYPGLYLFTTISRMVRPVKNLALDAIEMLGTFEQVYMDICINSEEAYAETTHQEINKLTFLSSLANLTPFSDFNQSPRNIYQCQMGKQTMGTPCHAIGHRADNKLYRIQTPQAAMVRPFMYDHYDMDNYPLGTNAVVAVISYTGYDMEDAMILNKGSVERGFTHATVYKSEKIDLVQLGKDTSGSHFVFGRKADNTSSKLDLDGLPPIGTYLQTGDDYYSYLNVQTGQYTLVKYKGAEPAHVDHIKVLGNDLGTGEFQHVCFFLRINRNPIIGDKFASRHGQKGICSMKWPVENMPFTETGMTPDILFNPHGFPSRMTIGMMIESMAGKSAASHGLCHDATPFTFSEDQPAIDYFGKMLTAAGYNYYGTERVYSGVSGLELEADIFVGIVYYQRLRHMVSDKFQVRSTGPVDKLTHQPIKGRKRGGGIRFGEMERDAMIAHGAAFLLQDRLFNCSDRSKAFVCKNCGDILSPILERPASDMAAVSFEMQRKWTCRLCKTLGTVVCIDLPFVFRYLVAELASVGIKVELNLT